MTTFNGFLVVKLARMGSRSETRQYFLQQQDNTETPVVKKNEYADPKLQQFESRKVTMKGHLGTEGIVYNSISEYETSHLPATASSGTSLSLIPGSLGGEVLQLQSCLKELGYPVVTDAYFGDPTVEAVKTFQVDHGLNPDGLVTPETWEALEKKLKEK